MIYSPTATLVTASSSRTVSGQLVTFTATVTPGALDGDVPTGTVQFLVDGHDSGAPVPIAGGKATITWSPPQVGNHPVSAIYSSNSLVFTGSSSPLQTASVGSVGNGPYQFSGAATAIALSGPNGLAVDAHNDLFIADEGGNAVYEVTPYGTTTIVAGTGAAGYSGDGGLAVDAKLNFPQTLALDTKGDLFIADVGNNVVREVTPGPGGLSDGTITTVAGNGTAGYSGDGDPATSAMLNYPNGVAVDAKGDLFIADSGNNVVREVTVGDHGLSDGTITTVAGDVSGLPGYSGDTGPAVGAMLSNPNAVAVNLAGDLFIADYGNGVVREVTPGIEGLSDGTITTFAGDGSFGYWGDGGAATSAMLNTPNGLVVDANQNLLISDAYNGSVRMVDPGGTITTVASGLNYPGGLALDSFGDLFIADQGNNVVRELTAGSDSPPAGGSLPIVAGGGPRLMNSTGVAVDLQGDLFIADQGNGVVNEVTPAGVTTTVVTGLNQPSGLLFDGNGDLFIADTGDNVVREVTPGTDHLLSDGTITTVVGNGSLNLPTGLAMDSHGDLFIADTGNNVVREVTPGSDHLLSDGTITTVASSGSWFSPLYGNESLGLNNPTGLAVDANGDLFIADTGNDVVWKETPGSDNLLTDGTMTVVAGNGNFFFFGQGGSPAIQSPLDGPSGLTVDAQGDLFIDDVGFGNGGYILEVLPNGIMTNVASFGSEVSYNNSGSTTPFWVQDYSGTQVELQGLAMDAQGDLLFARYPGVGFAGYPGVAVLATADNTFAPMINLTSSSATSVAGQEVTFTAAVTPQVLGGGTPTGTVTFMDGTTALDTETLSEGAASFTSSALAVGTYEITAVYSGDSNFVTRTSDTLTQYVYDLTNLQSVIAAQQSSGGITLVPTTTSTLTSTLEAIANLAPSSTAIAVDLGNTAIYAQYDSGNVVPIVASAPSGVKLTISCPSGNATVYDLETLGSVDVHGTPGAGNITIVGNSPALTVLGGDVTIGPGVTLITTTNSPTILVTRGSLTLRGAVVEESTSYTQTAILITGGTVDLGTAASPGDNTLNVNGAGQFLQSTTSSPIPDTGNTLEVDGVPLAVADLSLTNLGSSAGSTTYGSSVTLTATVRAANPDDGAPAGSVDFIDTTTGVDLGTVPVSSGVAQLTTTGLAAGTHAITARYLGDTTFAFSQNTLTEIVIPAPLTVTANNTAMFSGAAVPALTYTYTSLVNGDTGSVLTGALATTATSSSSAGSYPITQGTLSAGANYAITFVAGTLTVTASTTMSPGSIYILDPTAGGALTVSGNAQVKLTGDLVVDSRSTHGDPGQRQRQGHGRERPGGGWCQQEWQTRPSPRPALPARRATRSPGWRSRPLPATQAPPSPRTSAATSSARSIPGLYSQITVSGNAKLTLNPGVYVIAGGGVTASGNAVAERVERHLHHRGGRLLRVRQRHRHRLGSDDLQRRQQLRARTARRHLRRNHAERQWQLECTHDRDVRRDPDLPGPRQRQGPDLQRQRHAGITGTIYAPAAQLVESGNAQLGSAQNPISIVVDTLTISGNAIANGLTLDAPAGTVAYTPAQIRAAYGISSLARGRHRPDHRHRRCLRQPEYLPGPRRVRHPVRADADGADAVPAVRAGVVVLDGAQPDWPGDVPARDRPGRGRHRQLGSRGSARRRMGACHRARGPDHPRRGQQPVAVRPDGRRGHRRQPARRVGGVDELGLPRRPGRLRRR